MGRWLLVIFGALLVLVGVVWTLQGLGYLAGSVMTGVTLWAIIGPIVALVGLVLLVMGARRLRTPGSGFRTRPRGQRSWWTRQTDEEEPCQTSWQASESPCWPPTGSRRSSTPHRGRPWRTRALGWS